MTEQDSNSDLGLATEPKWRVLHPIFRVLGSEVQLPMEFRVGAPGCRRAGHPATVGLLRAQQNSVQGGAKQRCQKEGFSVAQHFLP